MWRRTSVGMAVGAALIASLALAQQPRGPGRGGFGGFGGPGGFGGSSAMLLGIPEVQKELTVSDEQRGLIETMLTDLREEMRASFGSFNPQELQSLSEEDRRKRFDEVRTKAEATTKKADEMLGVILEPKQVDRLNQLRLQREGVGAINRPDVARQLGVTESQQEKIRKIQQDARPQGGQGGFQNLSDDERRAFFARMQEQREKVQADILAVLSDEQKAKWGEMKGKAFTFPAPQGFGGAGGNAGERRRPEANKKDQ